METIDRLDYIKSKNLYLSKDPFKSVKSQGTKWERVFATQSTKSSLEEYMKNSRSVRRDLNKYFTKENIKMVCEDIKRYPSTLVIVKMQIKTTLADSIHPPDWLKLKMN